MRRISIIGIGVAIVAACGLLMAKEFWDKPYNKWKRDEAMKILHNSPWTRSQTMVDVITAKGRSSAPGQDEQQTSPTDPSDRVGGRTSGVTGNNEIYNSVTARFFSALPVRHAYVRTIQLMNNYDDRSDVEKAKIDEKFSRVLNIDFSKTIMIAMEFAGNDQQTKLSVARFLEYLKPDQIKQSCFLISDRLGRVEIEAYYPPSPDGSGAKFVFPRTVDDKPVVSPEDKEVKFEFWMDPLNQKVFIQFKVKDMMYNGQLAI